MRQGLLCGSLTRLWIVNRPAFPFGLASLEVLQHHQPLPPPPAQSPIGAIPVAKAGIRPQGSGINDLSASRWITTMNIDEPIMASARRLTGARITSSRRAGRGNANRH